MSMRRIHVFAAAFLTAKAALAAPPRAPSDIPVTGPRLHVSDLLPGAPADVGSVDLGPVPPPSGSRTLARADVLEAIRQSGQSEPKAMPETFRVVRKMKTLPASEARTLVEEALAAALPKGAALGSVSLKGSLEVPDGWNRVRAEIPKPPRKSGPFSTRAVLSFQRDDDTLFQTNLPVELRLSAEAAMPDLARSAPVTLVIRRGLVEVSIQGNVTIDADVGDVVPVMLRPSGRILRGKLVDKDHVIATEPS